MVLDHTIPYALSNEYICNSPGDLVSVAAKYGAAASNPVCDGTADVLVSKWGSVDGWTVCHALDPLKFESTGDDWATGPLYSGVLMVEVEENRVATAAD